MNKWKKNLLKIPKTDRDAILRVLDLLYIGDLGSLDMKPISGTRKSDEKYRIRVRNYRIIFAVTGKHFVIEKIERKNDRTYR